MEEFDVEARKGVKVSFLFITTNYKLIHLDAQPTDIGVSNAGVTVTTLLNALSYDRFGVRMKKPSPVKRITTFQHLTFHM